MTAVTPTPAKLRDAIADAIWRFVSADDVPHICDAVGMPRGAEGANPWDSKRRYVRNRLIGLTPARLADIARAVAEEYDDPDLIALISPAGLRGVDGELKNLIFARSSACRDDSERPDVPADEDDGDPAVFTTAHSPEGEPARDGIGRSLSARKGARDPTRIPPVAPRAIRPCRGTPSALLLVT
jgi:hypothetical protein